MPEQLTGMSKKSKISVGKIIGIIAAAFVIIVAFLLMYIFKDDNAGLKAVPSAEPLQKIIENSVSGKENEFSSTQFNQLCAYLIEKNKSKENVPFEQLYFAVRKDNSVLVYSPMNINGMHLGVTSVLNLTFNQQKKQIQAKVNSIHIGRLQVPVKWTLNRIQKKLSQGITVDGDCLLIDSVLLSYHTESEKTPIEITDFRVENEKIVFRTTGFASAVQEYLKDFGDWLKGLFDS